MKKRGFTLIELLVVIAIISLLVSILLPSLNKAKELAKVTVCSANLRAIGTSHTLYADDFDGNYYRLSFLGGAGIGAEIYPDYWPFLLYFRNNSPEDEPMTAGEYLDYTTLYCPNFEGNLSPYSKKVEWEVASRIGYCKFVNSYFDWDKAWDTTAPPTDGKFDTLSNVEPDQALAQDILVDSTGGWFGNRPAEAHEGGANVVFTDCHVEWVEQKTMDEDADNGSFLSPSHSYTPGTWFVNPKRM